MALDRNKEVNLNKIESKSHYMIYSVYSLLKLNLEVEKAKELDKIMIFKGIQQWEARKYERYKRAMSGLEKKFLGNE